MTGLTGTSPAHDVVRETLDRWRRAFDGRSVAEMVSLFVEDALFQGISPRLRAGRAEIAEYYGDAGEGTRATVQVLEAQRLGDGLVGGFADVTFTARAGETFPSACRSWSGTARTPG
ncbi:nuclear transport factor 2 family protein [Nonomuraea sp. B5E05]|uniref:DUF4440 domain-containing protein n=1 Tax=Nonomuraea sp. B5E05 TaxID=3153569 RepID=UPI003260CA1B